MLIQQINSVLQHIYPNFLGREYVRLTPSDYNFSLSDYRFFENPKREYTDFKRGRMNRHYVTTTSPFLTTGFFKILNASIVISNGVE